MASIIKPSMLRQTCRSLPAKKLFSTNASISPALRSISCSRSGPQIQPQRPAAYRSSIVRDALPGSMRVAAFHASGRKAILPPGPQVIDGTANDPAPVPHPSPTHGSYHWTFERLICVGLIPLTIAPFAAGSIHPITDAVLCGTLLIHSHIGFQAIIIDYIPGKRLPKTNAAFWWGLRAATLTVAVGLYEFETNDVGLTEAIKRVWKA